MSRINLDGTDLDLAPVLAKAEQLLCVLEEYQPRAGGAPTGNRTWELAHDWNVCAYGLATELKRIGISFSNPLGADFAGDPRKRAAVRALIEVVGDVREGQLIDRKGRLLGVGKFVGQPSNVLALVLKLATAVDDLKALDRDNRLAFRDGPLGIELLGETREARRGQKCIPFAGYNIAWRMLNALVRAYPAYLSVSDLGHAAIEEWMGDDHAVHDHVAKLNKHFLAPLGVWAKHVRRAGYILTVLAVKKRRAPRRKKARKKS
jgi:hypothetical protein